MGTEVSGAVHTRGGCNVGYWGVPPEGFKNESLL